MPKKGTQRHLYVLKVSNIWIMEYWCLISILQEYISNFILWQVSQKKILGHLVVISMQKTMVAMVISELKSIYRLKIFSETGQ